MNGFQITFYTQQNRQHQHKPMADWLIDIAIELQLHGATQMAASKGVGKHHHLHSAHFFELADQPQTVTMIVSDNEANRLLERIQQEQVEIFYVKNPVTFGILGHAE